MNKQYRVKFVTDTEPVVLWLSMYEWFDIFRLGSHGDKFLEWIEPLNDSSKRVAFAENVNVQA